MKYKYQSDSGSLIDNISFGSVSKVKVPKRKKSHTKRNKKKHSGKMRKKTHTMKYKKKHKNYKSKGKIKKTRKRMMRRQAGGTARSRKKVESETPHKFTLNKFSIDDLTGAIRGFKRERDSPNDIPIFSPPNPPPPLKTYMQ